MLKVVSNTLMRASDGYTIDRYVSAEELMYRAGAGVYSAVEWYENTAIVCGSGNNAGDGYVLGSLLTASNKNCTVFLLSERFSPLGRFYFDKLTARGVKVKEAERETFDGFDTVVDCIFGTGYKGELDPKALAVINAINASGKRVISVDINSGLNGDSGIGHAVHSDVTVSIGYPKSGHYLNDAKDCIKKLINVDIGIRLTDEPYYLVESADFQDIFVTRAQNSHKNTYGGVGILGGCINYSGAVKLANMSCNAMRVGAGQCRVITAKSLAQSVTPYLLELSLIHI